MSRRIYDISPAIDEKLQVWPGDAPPTRTITGDIDKGSVVTTSILRSTTHMGSHVDGPNHYGKNAPGVDWFPLERFVGECQVVTAKTPKGKRVTVDQLAAEVRSARVIIRTGTFPDFTNFNRDFAALSPALVETLAGRGVRLIGVDTPSVDLFDSKDLPAHQAFLRTETAILEGLVMKDVPDGVYELIALPLKLIGYDASPVRAVLREM